MMLGLLRCSQDNDGLFGMTLAKKFDRNCISHGMMIQNGEQIVRDFHETSVHFCNDIAQRNRAAWVFT